MGGNLRLEDPTAWIKAMDFVRTEFSGCEKTRKTGLLIDYYPKTNFAVDL